MQEYLNESTLFATVAMYLGESKELVLVVEGDDDHLVLKKHCEPGLRLIRGTGGKRKVLQAAVLAHEHGLDRAKFLVDKDYDAYGHEPVPDFENTLYSEHHDFFMDLVIGDPSIVSEVIEVHVDKVRRRPGKPQQVPSPENIYQEAITLASHLAAMRIVDKRMGLSLDFKRFSFGQLKVDQFDITSVVDQMLSKSPRAEFEVPDLLAAVVATRQEIEGMRNTPLGDHDFFAALARVLKRYRAVVSSQDLQVGFILAVKCRSLARTRWLDEIAEWCAEVGITGFCCRSGVELAA